MLFYATSLQILVIMFVAFLAILGFWTITAMRWVLSEIKDEASKQISFRAIVAEEKPRKQVPSLALVP